MKKLVIFVLLSMVYLAYSEETVNSVSDEGAEGIIDDDDDGDLSPEEMKSNLKVLLEKVDLNKDNEVDRNELERWTLKSLKIVFEDEALENFHGVDTNGDGEVTWKEYLSETYGTDKIKEIPFLNTPVRDDVLQHIKDQMEIFKIADKDQNGALSWEEFHTFSFPEDYEHTLSTTLKHSIAKSDKDNDGHLTFEEFFRVTDLAPEDRDPEQMEAGRKAFYEMHDRDGDGLLTHNHDELRSYLIPRVDELAERQALRLMSHSDDNHDGILSFQEILDHHDEFASASATNFGTFFEDTRRFSDEL